MKYRIAVLFMLLVLPFSWISAQNANIERLNSYKIAFFTKRLNLTSKEAEKFWPVYNEFQEKKVLIQQERALLNKNLNLYGTTMSENEIIEAGDRLVGMEMKEAVLAQEFHRKFREVLPPEKVLRLYQTENQYRQQLLNELQERRNLRENMIQR